MILDIVTKRNVNDPPMYPPKDNAGTTEATNVLDTQGARGVEILVIGGAWTGTGSMAPTLQESNTKVGADFAAVAAEDYVGGAAPVTISAANSVRKMGYLGTKRYLRVMLTKTGTVTLFFVTVTGALEFAYLMPGDDPSAVAAT